LVVQSSHEGASEAGHLALTDVQRELVREHLGLVGVHLRRYGGDLATPRDDRERDDLFQEGCLGLMRAAADFDASRGIPFAAFAFPRIHNAVSRAMATKFSMVQVPWRSRARGVSRGGLGGSGRGGGRGGGDQLLDDVRGSDRGGSCGHDSFDSGREQRRHRPDRPRRRSLSDGLGHESCSANPAPPELGDGGETLGDRLRGKYERAIRRACELVLRRSSARGDRKKLAEVIAEERLLIPEETHRLALRQIARDTGSSYARVSDCERRMVEKARAMLVGDPEFGTLRRRAKETLAGVAAGLDDTTERELANVSAAEFVRRFGVSKRPERMAMLERLLAGSADGFSRIVEQNVARMSATERETLFSQ